MATKPFVMVWRKVVYEISIWISDALDAYKVHPCM